MRKLGAGAILGAVALLIATMFAAVLLIFGPASSAGACGSGSASTVDTTNLPAGPIDGYAGEQLQNAAAIMNAASALGLGQDAQIIGVMTAMGESGLRVLDYGDQVGPDSRGLFQQRDNGVWGSLSDRMDPTISATNFFRALQKIDGWQQLEPTIAAHRVQGNADPYFYETYFTKAQDVVSQLGRGSSAGSCGTGYLGFPLKPGFQMTDNYGPRPFRVEGASTWHPADDLQHAGNACHDPIYAITAGTVTYLEGYQLSIKSPDGYTVSYLHEYLNEVLVKVGDQVTTGEQIGATGANGPATGCHLDLRINVAGNTNPIVAGLQKSQDDGAPSEWVNWVDPEQFYQAFGLTLCPPDSCRRAYNE